VGEVPLPAGKPITDSGLTPMDQLPVAMRFRMLRHTARRRLQVRKSRIEGLGVYALDDIEVRCGAHDAQSMEKSF